MKSTVHSLVIICSAATLMLLTSCGSTPPSRFYLLSPMDKSVRTTSGGQWDDGIVVGPVSFPQYLERPQIVSYAGDNQLRLGEYDRWGEALEDNMLRVLAQNIGILLNTNKVFVYPLPADIPVRYRIIIDIMGFEQQSDDRVKLDLRWGILSLEEGGVIVTGNAVVHRDVASKGYADIVREMSLALGEASREIAEALKTNSSQLK